MTPESFEAALQAQRGFGRVFCDWRDRSRTGEPVPDELDEYVALVFGEVHDSEHARGGFRQVSSREARQQLAFWLERNLGDLAVASPDLEAKSLEPFFALFGPSARYFSNVSQAFPANGARSSFMTKTLHDFDAGIIVADDARIGLVWFADDE